MENVLFFGGHNLPLFIVTVVAVCGAAISLGLLYFRNVSGVIAQRLLKEVNVVMILMFGSSIFALDCYKPGHPIISPLYGLIYLFAVILFVFLDAVKMKSRLFVFIVGITFGMLTLWCVYDRTFNGTDVGVILFQYGDDYVFRKRSIKRSCFVQISLFSINGLWTIFKDKKMEMMMFATGHIYRETGTASKYVEDREHITRMRSETAESMV